MKHRVLFISVDALPMQGGIANFAHHCTNAFARCCEEVVFLGPKGTRIPPHFEASYALIVDEKSEPKARTGSKYSAQERRIKELLLAIIKKHRLNRILLFHPFYYGPAAASLARELGIPCEIVVHGTELASQFPELMDEAAMIEKRPIDTLAMHLHAALNQCTGIVANSTFTAGLASRIAPQVPVSVCGCGIPRELFDELGAIGDHDASAVGRSTDGEPRRRLVYVGRLVPHKRVDAIFDLLVPLNATLAIIGDGPMEDELRAEAARKGLASRIEFQGRADEETKWSAVRKADFLMLPSAYEASTGGFEGFGIVLLEAIAAGTIPVCSAREGSADPVRTYGLGLEGLGPKSSTTRTVEAMASLLDDPAAYRRKLEHDRTVVRENLLWEHVADRISESWQLPTIVPTFDLVPARRELDETLQAFGPASIVVVADEYPPQTTGGAEISLHEIVRHSGMLDEILIVKFTGPPNTVQSYVHDGVRVLVLPERKIWPQTTSPDKGATAGLRVRLAKVRRTLSVLRRHGNSAPRRAALRLASAKRIPSGGLQADGLVEKYEAAAAQLADVLKGTDATTVLANNTRSIMTCSYSMELHASAWSAVRSIAMVRDNRFRCVRHDQSVMVRGRPCGTCDFACAPVDAPNRPDDQRTVLEAARQARRGGLARFDEVVTTSAFLQRQLQDVLGGQRRIGIVPNFAGDPDEVERHRAKAVENGRDVIVVVGSLNEAKGQKEFVQSAFAKLEDNPSLEVHLIGKGPRMEGNIRKMLGDKPIAERIVFQGFLEREALYAAIAQAKVVVLPTLWPEPFGRVPLEAGLCRKPVVAFDSGAYRETIKDGETGFIVPRSDYDALWNRIDELLGDGGERRRMGDAGYEWVTHAYSKERSISAFRAVLGGTPSFPETKAEPLDIARVELVDGLDRGAVVD